MKALIGVTGFVGSNLAQQLSFDETYHSKNIDTISGKHFELLVIAAPSAVKWYANQHPEEDYEHVTKLIRQLSSVTASAVVLCSTVDVYPRPIEVDEDTGIDADVCQPYGKHRLLLEKSISKQFSRSTIIRLPGLFGTGLKKNIIFDFLNKNNIEKIDSRYVFQFYPLERIGKDLLKVYEKKIPLINFATEPVQTSEVARVCLDKEFTNHSASTLVKYDFRSKYAEAFSEKHHYLLSRAEVLASLRRYVDSVKSTA